MDPQKLSKDLQALTFDDFYSDENYKKDLRNSLVRIDFFNGMGDSIRACDFVLPKN